MPESTLQLLILSFASASILISFCLIFVIINLKTKIGRILSGGAKDLPEAIDAIRRQIKNLESFKRDADKFLNIMSKKVARSVQSTEVLRYSPFAGAGTNGNQSFSVCFVNEGGDGIVVSGLYYSRDRVSIFMKPVADFASSFELTPEEKEVIARSKQKLGQ